MIQGHLTGDFDTVFDSFCGEVQAMLTKETETNFPSLKPPILTYKVGQKWIKLVTERSVYAFIATQDFATKGLGEVKMGDIHMAASYSAPAKHKRGNIFEQNRLDCCGPYGINYLK